MFHILFDPSAPARELRLATGVEGGKLPPAVSGKSQEQDSSLPQSLVWGAALHKTQVGV